MKNLLSAVRTKNESLRPPLLLALNEAQLTTRNVHSLCACRLCKRLCVAIGSDAAFLSDSLEDQRRINERANDTAVASFGIFKVVLLQHHRVLFDVFVIPVANQQTLRRETKSKRQPWCEQELL
jgi:hypothetical protein